MKVFINITLFCIKQGLALRGHDEKSLTVSNTGRKICFYFSTTTTTNSIIVCKS